MNKIYKNILGLVCLSGLVVMSASAVDQAAAAGDLAEISALSVMAKANLSQAALGGDVDAIAEAVKRSDAVDASVNQAMQSYADIVVALRNGDEDAAQSAADAIRASLEKAMDALNGVIPEQVADAVNQWKDSKANTAGGPGQPYDPPNMYDVPWNSQQMRAFYQSQFGNFWNAGLDPSDNEATPE
ncbi:hypothetical protein P4E94_13815 [Pontiellaceae bacterium B12219]|nr:hypothetical protein [Pontiellaceae bacterium B12219]